MNIDRDVRYATTHTKGEKQYGKSSQNWVKLKQKEVYRGS
jgi:hypothetical protein